MLEGLWTSATFLQTKIENVFVEGLWTSAKCFCDMFLKMYFCGRFVDQCDMCRKMFVRDSPAPTVGQKLVGGDCQVRCSNMFSNNFHCTDPFQVNISLQATKSNGRNCRGKLRDFVLDWEAELPQEVCPLMPRI